MNNDLKAKPGELEELRRENAYLRRLAETTVAKMLQMDAQSITIRHELEQKRRGFSLMADLAVTLGQDADYESVFVSVSRRLNSALNMQRTVVLVPDSEGLFRAMVMQGYPLEERKLLSSRRLQVPPEMLQPLKPVLVTGADPPERFAVLRQALGLPYLISSPVLLHRDVVAILITGRVSEQKPFLTRLGHSDVETVQTVSAYLAAMLAGHRLLEAENLANYDPLTHLPNLRRTKEGLQQVLSLARRGSAHAAVMFVDLDGFKSINDNHGHAAGDEVLRIVADRLTHCVRESDLVGRIGGDEFLVVLSHIGRPEDAGVVAGKILEKMSEPINVYNTICQIGASIGIAIFPDHGREPDELIKAADEAMYAVKSKGKNDYSFVEDILR